MLILLLQSEVLTSGTVSIYNCLIEGALSEINMCHEVEWVHTVVDAREDRKKEEKGERKKNEERKKKKTQNERKKKKVRKNEKEKNEKNYTWLLSYTQKTKPSKKCFMPFAQKSHSFHMKKISQLISFAHTKVIPIKDIIIKR